MRHVFAVLLITTVVVPLQAGAAMVPVGPQFEVNTYSTGEQSLPVIASGADGGFVVVWESEGSNGGDTASFSVQGQLFSSTGAPLGTQFQINSYTSGAQRRPAIAHDADGNFVVVWQSDGSSGGDTASWSVQGRRYSAAGEAQGAQFQVNTYTTNIQEHPSIASASDGDFVVVWESAGSTGSDTFWVSVQGQRYSAAGVPQGPEFQINSYTTGHQILPAVASGATGDFIAVWRSDDASGNDSAEASIAGQRYSAAGTPLGPEFQVNSYTTNNQSAPAIASGANGDFIAVWSSLGSSGGDTSWESVQGQRYSAAGAPQGPEFQVNTFTTNSQDSADIATDADGDFVVVWQSQTPSGTFRIDGQRYWPTGEPLGTEFQINSYTTGLARYPAIAMDPGGDFVVVWQSDFKSGSDISGSSVQGQRYRVTGDLAGRVFLDQDSDGLQNGGEPGIAGITVELYDDTPALRGTTVTDGDGNYVLQPKAGRWTLKFVPRSNGFSFTDQDAGGDDALDSDADRTTGETDQFFIFAAVLEETIDAGFLPIIFADGFESADSSAWSATVP